MDMIDITCPLCGTKVGTFDMKSTIDKKCKCRRCNKLVVYVADKHDVITKRLPERVSSSGVTFLG